MAQDPDEISRLYMSPRAVELQTLDAYVEGKQYAGRKIAWLDETSATPLFDRKPCINYKLVATAIGSHVDFVLGEGRWPLITSGTSEDDTKIDEDWGLDEKDSKVLDSFVNTVLVKFARLKKVSREMLSLAMASRSVAVICSVKKGRLTAETVKAGWCTPTIDDLGECSKLEISYPYIDSFYDVKDRKWKKRCLIYRRVIDDKTDTTYLPAEGRSDGAQPDWKEDASKSGPHGLGFCPVVWYPFMKKCATAQTVDGVALHDDQLGEIDMLNMSLSQKQRASLVSGDPQAYETGVSEDENPAPSGAPTRGGIDPIGAMGPDGKPIGIFKSYTSANGNTSGGGPQFGPGGNRRMRGAGVLWRYTNDKAKVGYLELGQHALASIAEHSHDLRGKLSESFWAVLIDPTELRMHAALSGKALAFLYSRQTAFDDGVRDDFFDNGLSPLISMLLRIVYVLGSKNARALYLPGVTKVLPVLVNFMAETAGDNGEANGGSIWMPTKLDAVWGPYFPPDPQDQLFTVQLTAAAKEGGMATTQMCVEKLSSEGVFEVADAASVVDAINEEKDEDLKKQQNMLHEGLGALNGDSKPNKKPAAGSSGSTPPSGSKGAKGSNGRLSPGAQS